METFLILAVIIFLPFIWFIRRMLRFTDETVGDDSLVFGLETSTSRTRTYQYSDSDYFGTFSKMMYAVLLVMMLLVAYIVVKAAPQQEGILGLLLFSFAPGFFAFALYLAYCFYIDWKFWTITRNVSVTFDPYTPSITIDGPQDFAVFTPDALSHIDHHLLKIDNPRHLLFRYGCLCLHSTNGQFIWVNAAFFEGFSPQSFLEQFFPNVPTKMVWYPLPYTSVIDQFGSVPTAEP